MSGEWNPVIQQVFDEQGQSHPTRKGIFECLESLWGRPVVSFFTSFRYVAPIEDADADMLEGVLQKLDLYKGLALIISSPGGDGLAAERIINICRSYGGGDYWAVVPSKAKSAATMICFGASKILMSPTSELGTVDPQVAIVEDGVPKWFSAHNLVNSYDELFRKAVEETGNLQPYLQQLTNYDERQIAEFRSFIELSKSISVKALASGMMKRKGLSPSRIEKKITDFLTPGKTKVHGRPIYWNEASRCGLEIELQDVRSDVWRLVYELYVRTDSYVTTRAAKSIESRYHSYAAQVTKRGDSA